MRRNAIGIIAIVLFVGAVYFRVCPPEGAFWTQFEAACWRVGALMAVIWLAYPEVARLPGWALGMVPLLGLVLAIRPKYLLIAVPIVIAMAILKPRVRRR
jgi:hypothetical protein